MSKQSTIAKEITFEGVGLHNGREVTVCLKPAEANTGIRFRSMDIKDSQFFKADVNCVSSTNRGTFLEKGNQKIGTVEHLLSALHAADIDNVDIEVNNGEIPIMDGSALAFSEQISQVGRELLEADQKELVIEKHMEFVDEDSGSSYILLPSLETEYVVMIDYGSKSIPKQFANFKQGDNYLQEIAPCRTFVFAQDLMHLLDQDLIKGGDVSNAIIYSDEELSSEHIEKLSNSLGKKDLKLSTQGVLNNVSLHFENEAARHKLLDLIGDLKLLGAKIKGKIIARKPGHTGNAALVKFLKKELQKQKKLKGRPIYSAMTPISHDVEAIKKLIPHRYPFLFVERIIELTETKVVGIKNVSFNEQIFQGHFPGNPVFPGVLQMEALAQTGGILALSTVEEPEKYDTYFLKMDNVKFKQKVVPGDTMILKMELLSPIRRGIVHMQGTVYVGDAIVSEGELTAQIVKSR